MPHGSSATRTLTSQDHYKPNRAAALAELRGLLFA
jgi:hypothetical protein